MSPEHFEEHLCLLKKFRLCRLSEVPESMRPGSVVVTFDDGYADNLHCAAQLLNKHEIPATFFLTSGYLGGYGEFWWDELERRLASTALNHGTLELVVEGRALRWDMAAVDGAEFPWLPVYYELYDLLQPLQHARRLRILREIPGAPQILRARESHRVLNLSEVSDLASMERIEIGAHTVTHPRLASLIATTQLAEMRESRRFLEEAAGCVVRSFSYPFGDRGHYNDESVQMAREAGFSVACTTAPGTVERASSRFELPRVVVGDMDGDQFEHLLNSCMHNAK
ncbi:MAG TPA: polysaccharide deacetylase family protein [Bryobacteraceae bacterium]